MVSFEFFTLSCEALTINIELETELVEASNNSFQEAVRK